MFYPVPFDKIVATVCTDAKLRRLVKNMIYDGVLSHLLGIDMGEMEKATAQAVRQEGEGGRPEHGRAQGRRRVRAAAPAEARSVLGRADAQDRRQILDRREHRRRARRDVRRRHRRRLVSDHPLVVAARGADRLHEEAPRSTRRPGRRPTRSSRRKTRSPRSAWCSAPAGPARAP